MKMRTSNIRHVCVQFSYVRQAETNHSTSRWLRLLFTRELSLDDAMVLWDALFAVDPSFDLALWICVAMLVRIRNKRESTILSFSNQLG